MQGMDLVNTYLELVINSEKLKYEDEIHSQFWTFIYDSLENVKAFSLNALLR
jgi:hypothetical protein